uniref:Extracellular calcium-sensing receptor-like n=1 Tax=Kryptolebias marmoratus TaxID=37003 RepID=A0A3Q3B534_KRYMA
MLSLFSLLYSVTVLMLTYSPISSFMSPATSSAEESVAVGPIIDNESNTSFFTFCVIVFLCMCSFDPRAFRWAQTMRLAVEEINQNQELLPNHTLGYKIFDSCAYPLTGQRAALAVLNGLSEEDSPTCRAASPLIPPKHQHFISCFIVMIFPPSLTQISYFSSCACFTDRRKYPTFFRVIPNDDYQVKAIAQLLVRFSWTWVGLIRGDHEYGRFAVQGLLRELQGTNVCVAYQEMIPLLYNSKRALEIISSAKVVVVFSAEGEMTPFLRDYMTQNITGIQWVASEAWITADYLLTVTPQRYPNNILVQELWEALYGCNPFLSSASQLPPCSGKEELLGQHSAYTNTSSPRVAYNVYKAVYAVAHSLHNLLLCQPSRGPFENKSCVNFDLKGDSVPYYDIINWQRGSNGNIEFVNVGLFDGTKPAGEELVIQEDRIMWAGHQSEVPVSVCSPSCTPGSRKAVRRGEPVCCFDCSIFLSCIPKRVEFLTFDSLGIALLVISVVGACLTIGVFVVFFYHKNTAIVRVNNSELSFFILFALTLCFLCSLVFIGKPTFWSCMLRHTAFSITFSLCISCILGKTLVVLAAFTATRPGDNIMKWLGPKQQRAIIFSCTFIQVVICAAWLFDAPPYPSQNTKYERSKIILECSVGSSFAFWCVLGYIGLQACLCFVLAFLARKLPGNFNEAKFITFSMLIFCAVWLAFIPAYISSPGNYADAVESFAILASSFGLLFCLFAPKCYIILLKPEKNTKQHLLGKEKK